MYVCVCTNPTPLEPPPPPTLTPPPFYNKNNRLWNVFSCSITHRYQPPHAIRLREGEELYQGRVCLPSSGVEIKLNVDVMTFSCEKNLRRQGLFNSEEGLLLERMSQRKKRKVQFHYTLVFSVPLFSF